MAIIPAACSSSDDTSSAKHSLAELSTSGTTCPVDLAAAVRLAGVTVDGSVAAQTEASNGPADGKVPPVDDQSVSPLDAVGGAVVTCTLTPAAPAQPVTLMIAALARDRAPGSKADAVGLLLPAMVKEFELTTADAGATADRVVAAKVGSPVSVGKDGAATRLEVNGAKSAAAFVSIPDATPEQAKQVLAALVDQL